MPMDDPFRAKLKQAANRPQSLRPAPPTTERDLAEMATRLRTDYGIAPSVTEALAIEARPRRESW